MTGRTKSSKNAESICFLFFKLLVPSRFLFFLKKRLKSGEFGGARYCASILLNRGTRTTFLSTERCLLLPMYTTSSSSETSWDGADENEDAENPEDERLSADEDEDVENPEDERRRSASSWICIFGVENWPSGFTCLCGSSCAKMAGSCCLRALATALAKSCSFIVVSFLKVIVVRCNNEKPT